MSDDELANVAINVGLEHHNDSNPIAAKLGSLGAPTRSDNLFASLLNSTTSSSIDSVEVRHEHECGIAVSESQ